MIRGKHMYVKRVKSEGGRIRLKYAHNDYIPGKGSNPKIVGDIGFLDELKEIYPDPIVHFRKIAKQMNEDAAKEDKPETLVYDKNAKLGIDASEKNIGYAALSVIYHELGLDVFFNNHARKYKIQYSINAIMRLLVYMRVLKPGSKKKAYEKRNWFFESADFSLEDVYRALTYINDMIDSCQLWMHKRILKTKKRDMSLVFYDVTNYYFEIDEEDELRKAGVSKEHRPDPIVQMGLLMDNDGIPIAYRLFPGNDNDCTTFVPFIIDIRREYGMGQTVVVADKGMNTANNVYYLANRRIWYVFSQTVKGGSNELKKYVLNENGYRKTGSESKIKSRQFTRRVKIEQPGDAPPIEAMISEKQVILYSGDYARKAKRDRAKVIRKAKDIVKDPTKYNKYNSYGAAKYIKHLEYDGETGEIIDTKSIIQFNYEKVVEEEKYDGYYLIVTNAFDMDEDWVIEKYRGLWEIEETFKVTKSDLETRPVFMSLMEHIKAHFLTCFIALMIIKLLKKRLGGKYSSAVLIESMVRACCAEMEGNKFLLYYFDPVLSDLGNALGIDFSNKYWERNEIKKMLGGTKKQKKTSSSK